MGHRVRFPPRRLHVVDIENLVGYPLPSLSQVGQTRRLYLRHVAFDDPDQLEIACSHLARENVAFGWPGASYRIQSGRNGADRALLDVLQHENIAERFSHLVIGSGDHQFTRPARYLRSQGVLVTVASRPATLSRKLAQAADHLIILGPTAEAA